MTPRDRLFAISWRLDVLLYRGAGNWIRDAAEYAKELTEDARRMVLRYAHKIEQSVAGNYREPEVQRLSLEAVELLRASGPRWPRARIVAFPVELPREAVIVRATAAPFEHRFEIMVTRAGEGEEVSLSHRERLLVERALYIHLHTLASAELSDLAAAERRAN